MKERGKGFIAGVVASAVFVGLIGTAAATVGSRTVQADYSDIKVILNGEKITPKDANGLTVEPFAVNGTTYLPVRAICDAVGLDVGWDGETNTVLLYGDIPSIEKLGFYKSLSDGFLELQTYLDGILTGTSDMLVNTTVQEGPYAGMNFINATQSKLTDSMWTVDGHYKACGSSLTIEDIELATNYVNAVNSTKSYYANLRNTTSYSMKNQVSKTYYDVIQSVQQSDISFWQTYQQAFN